jgi:hypothetical protein
VVAGFGLPGVAPDLGDAGDSRAAGGRDVGPSRRRLRVRSARPEKTPCRARSPKRAPARSRATAKGSAGLRTRRTAGLTKMNPRDSSGMTDLARVQGTRFRAPGLAGHAETRQGRPRAGSRRSAR